MIIKLITKPSKKPIFIFLISLFFISISFQIQAGVKLEKRLGYLPSIIYQHPLIASPFDEQFYFNVGKQDSSQQIIVIYPKTMEIPTKKGIKIELTGIINAHSLGGEEGTKNSYRNEVMYLKSWRYLQSSILKNCWYTPIPDLGKPEPEFSEHEECGELNKQGLLVLKPMHLQQLEFAENGLATVYFEGQFYYVNKKGLSASVITYDNGADYFQEGLARTKINNKIGYINQKLELVIPAVYDWGFPFENGSAIVCQGCQLRTEGEHKAVVGGKWGKINVEGEILEALKAK